MLLDSADHLRPLGDRARGLRFSASELRHPSPWTSCHGVPGPVPNLPDSVARAGDCYPCSRTDLLPLYLDRTGRDKAEGSQLPPIVLGE
jgi:hypothetical protein